MSCRTHVVQLYGYSLIRRVEAILIWQQGF